MKVTTGLLGEHGVFYAQFDHLEQVVPNVESLALIKAQAGTLAAALETHAHLEDELLFDVLEPRIGPMGPLAVMRMEHDAIQRALMELPEIENLAEARNRLLQTVRVAREHFAKEEQVLYPMAEQMLDADTLTQQGQRWAERRDVHIP